MEILLLNGPNLDLLGTRTPEIYGYATLVDHVAAASEVAATYGHTVRDVQSNYEAELIVAIREARSRSAAIVFNAGALTHSSWALGDTLNMFEGPKVEVHISNPAAREPFRHTSTLARFVDGSIAGFGGRSYTLGVHAVCQLLAERNSL
jgi:3-dehydroquinate dehydratase-2